MQPQLYRIFAVHSECGQHIGKIAAHWQNVAVLLFGIAIAMHAHNEIGNDVILIAVDHVQHDEQQIETGQQRILQANIFHGRFVLIVLKLSSIHY